MALTPLHSLRLGVGCRDVVGRRSFRGTWEQTPPAPTGLAVVAEGAARWVALEHLGCSREAGRAGVVLWVRPQWCHVIRM